MRVGEGNSRRPGKNGAILEFWEVGVCPLEKRGGAVQDSSTENNLHGRGRKSGDLTGKHQGDRQKRVLEAMWN